MCMCLTIPYSHPASLFAASIKFSNCVYTMRWSTRNFVPFDHLLWKLLKLAPQNLQVKFYKADLFYDQPSAVKNRFFVPDVSL